MTRKLRLIGIPLIGLVLVSGIFYVLVEHVEKRPAENLKALIFYHRLQPYPVLVDPLNTDHTAQYYLLENLSSTLVRDHHRDPSGYEGVLARSWRQENETSWLFTLRDNLRWSNGEPLDPHYIIERIKTVLRVGSRHIIVLKRLKALEYDSSLHALRFQFEHPVGRSILHELALADLSIIYPSSHKEGWRITSGPYYVENFNDKEGTLTLKANPYCDLIKPGTPKKVTLVFFDQIKNKGTIGEWIASGVVDFAQLPSPVLKESDRVRVGSVPQIVSGADTVVYYFYFDPNHPLGQNKKARREFAYLLSGAMKSYRYHPMAHYESQFIPEGYEGRLADYQVPACEVSELRGRPIKIDLHPFFEKETDFIEALLSFAKSHGVELVPTFTVFSEKPLEKGLFALLSGMQGNQKDPMGTWSFVFDEAHGNLRAWRKEIAEDRFQKISLADDEARVQLLESLHHDVLDEALIVPFLIHPVRYGVAKGWDLSQVNRFDMRLRYYEFRRND